MSVSTSVCDSLDAAVRLCPDSVAIRDESGPLTYAELGSNSWKMASWLARNGVRRDDRVVVQAANSKDFVALMYGAFRIGAVFVPINPMMRPFHFSSVLADAEPALVVTDDENPRAPEFRSMAEVADVLLRPYSSVPDGTPGDIALIMYTSGSTSVPKGVVCPHRVVRTAVRLVSGQLGYRSDDVVYCRLPFSFDYGLYQVFLSVEAGAELVVAGQSPEIAALGHIRRHGVTVMPLLPLLARNLIALAERDRRPTTLRLFTNTGAALPKQVTTKLHDLFPDADVVLMYGMTECKRITVATPETALLKPGSVGKALPGTRLWIEGDPAPGEVGQILVEGPHLMQGYWRAPAQTLERFRVHPDTGGIVLYTGDYGYLDEDGDLFLVGRRDEIFKRRGMRTSTSEVEAAALDVPGVTAAVVLPPAESGELIVYVTGSVDEDTVMAGLAERLERPKVPDHCRVLDALPRNGNGKVDKQALAVGP